MRRGVRYKEGLLSLPWTGVISCLLPRMGVTRVHTNGGPPGLVTLGKAKIASHPYLRYARKYIGGAWDSLPQAGQTELSLGSPRDFPVRERRRVGDGRGTPGRSEP